MVLLRSNLTEELKLQVTSPKWRYLHWSSMPFAKGVSTAQMQKYQILYHLAGQWEEHATPESNTMNQCFKDREV